MILLTMFCTTIKETWMMSFLVNDVTSNQIKSNHFYCHITTAQVPWWVKFLWACSRQCRKTTDNLPMDRQCKKTTTDNLPMDRQCKRKTTDNLPMDRQCKKNNNRQFTYGQTVQKKTTDNLHMDRQCKKLHWSIYSAPDSAKKIDMSMRLNYYWRRIVSDGVELRLRDITLKSGFHEIFKKKSEKYFFTTK